MKFWQLRRGRVYSYLADSHYLGPRYVYKTWHLITHLHGVFNPEIVYEFNTLPKLNPPTITFTSRGINWMFDTGEKLSELEKAVLGI